MSDTIRKSGATLDCTLMVTKDALGHPEAAKESAKQNNEHMHRHTWSKAVYHPSNTKEEYSPI